ncbi:UDP-glucuronosyltransferase 1-1 [Scaptodrosophila lebanonensis]|uniref:UDP-glucuronosyltransferase n=1 Tax=Drosophila lebanonensis TaxID=7225 RepID=A0A6J2U5K6_DROLE|nr:UDP-glucuronosyltransferase 1-1 [Scaptodrosophila lebanonensis]
MRLSLVQLLLCWSALGWSGTSCGHILGIFVQVHRSQLLVYTAVARVLLQHGHQLTLITTLPLDSELELDGNLTHILVPWKQSAENANLSKDLFTRLQRTYERLEDAEQLLNEPEWQAFMAHNPTPAYDLLLLGYHFNDHLLGVAAHFNCPVAIITTQQPISFVHSLLGNPEERWYVPQPYDKRQRTGWRALAFGVWEKATELMARRVMRRIYSKHFSPSHYPSFDQMRQRVVLALNNHHMISEGPIAPLLPNMLDIGGICMEQGLKAIDTDIGYTRPFIYFSLGTRFSWHTVPSDFVAIFVEAFAQLPDYDIYWTYDGSNDSVSSISGTHSNIKLSQWWGQQQLLASGQIQLFITHGGKGSLTEALYYGVPMLGLPFLGDQHTNLRRMSRKGWGLYRNPRNLSSASLLTALRELLMVSQYRENIRSSSRLYRDRPLNASALTAYWLEYVMRHDGATHLHNPGRMLNWWQYYLLDVYATIYGCLLAVIIILRHLDGRT